MEYTPSINETLVCVGIWAFGVLLYTWLLRLAVPILTGEFRAGRAAVKMEDVDLELDEEPAPSH